MPQYLKGLAFNNLDDNTIEKKPKIVRNKKALPNYNGTFQKNQKTINVSQTQEKLRTPKSNKNSVYQPTKNNFNKCSEGAISVKGIIFKKGEQIIKMHNTVQHFQKDFLQYPGLASKKEVKKQHDVFKNDRKERNKTFFSKQRKQKEIQSAFENAKEMRKNIYPVINNEDHNIYKSRTCVCHQMVPVCKHSKHPSPESCKIHFYSDSRDDYDDSNYLTCLEDDPQNARIDVKKTSSATMLTHFKELLNQHILEQSPDLIQKSILNNDEIDFLNYLMKADEKYQYLKRQDKELLEEVLKAQVNYIQRQRRVVGEALTKLRKEIGFEDVGTSVSNSLLQPSDRSGDANFQRTDFVEKGSPFRNDIISEEVQHSEENPIVLCSLSEMLGSFLGGETNGLLNEDENFAEEYSEEALKKIKLSSETDLFSLDFLSIEKEDPSYCCQDQLNQCVETITSMTLNDAAESDLEASCPIREHCVEQLDIQALEAVSDRIEKELHETLSCANLVQINLDTDLEATSTKIDPGDKTSIQDIKSTAMSPVIQEACDQIKEAESDFSDHINKKNCEKDVSKIRSSELLQAKCDDLSLVQNKPVANVLPNCLREETSFKLKFLTLEQLKTTKDFYIPGNANGLIKTNFQQLQSNPEELANYVKNVFPVIDDPFVTFLEKVDDSKALWNPNCGGESELFKHTFYSSFERLQNKEDQNHELERTFCDKAIGVNETLLLVEQEQSKDYDTASQLSIDQSFKSVRINYFFNGEIVEPSRRSHSKMSLKTKSNKYFKSCEELLRRETIQNAVFISAEFVLFCFMILCLCVPTPKCLSSMDEIDFK